MRVYIQHATHVACVNITIYLNHEKGNAHNRNKPINNPDACK